MRHKYPRTFHLPWSQGATDDDKTHSEFHVEGMFEGHDVVVTEKMDGENTSIYPDGSTHARSLDSASHPSRTWIRQFAAAAGRELLPGMRICGENLFAKHSVGYHALPGYFLAFSLWEEETCLSWDDTSDWLSLLEVPSVPVLYRGPWDRQIIEGLWPFKSKFGAEAEGYVVRRASAFRMADFGNSVAKFVRKNHVQTGDHWMFSKITPNGVVSVKEG